MVYHDLQQSAYLGSQIHRRCILHCRHTCNCLVFRQHTLQVAPENKWIPRDTFQVFRYSFDLTYTSACFLQITVSRLMAAAASAEC